MPPYSRNRPFGRIVSGPAFGIMAQMLRSVLLSVLLAAPLFGRGAASDASVTPPQMTVADLLAKGRLDTPYAVEGWVVSPVESDWTIFRDETGGLFADDECRRCRTPGERIRATLVRRSEKLADGRMTCHVAIAGAVSLGFDAAAAKPVEIVPADLTRPDLYDCRRVTVRGTVTDVIRDELDPNWVFLFVEADGARAVVPVMLVEGNRPFPSDDELIDAEVAATGVFLANSNAGRRHLGPHVANYDGHALKVMRPAPKNPFADCPTTCFDAVSVARAKRDGHRRRTTGRVIATFDGNAAFLALKSDERIRVRFAKEAETPAVGTLVDVAGFVKNNVFFSHLVHAIWRKSDDSGFKTDDSVKDISARALLFDEAGQRRIQQRYDGRIVRLRGRVTDVLPADSKGRQVVALNSDGITVNVEAPATIAPAVGSIVDATGACLLLDSAEGADDFVRLEGFSLVLCAPGGLVVVSAPSWWTAQRLFVFLCVALAVILAAAVWNVLLHRLAERRGRQLAQAEIDGARSELKRAERTRLALELHDSLSQNLTGIVLQLDASRNARASDKEASGRHLDAALRMLQGCRTELRRCIWDLHSSVLDFPDFEEAIRTSLHPVAGGVNLAIRSHVSRALLSDNVAHAVIRILRELVANAIRHGRAKNVRVAGDISEGPLKFSVTDDGCGFPKGGPAGPEDGHFGLTGIRERLRELGGTLTIEAVRPTGTKAVFAIPSPCDKPKEEP